MWAQITPTCRHLPIQPVGIITLASDESGLVGTWIEGQKYHGATIPDGVIVRDDMPIFHTVKEWLNKYFAGKKPDISALPRSSAALNVYLLGVLLL
ncbi:hypothetical protein [Paenibacillus rhizosphaerae]|uniref:hypothetical protein n=1 Tax=Paenibacillus rhizosphaerae TaxID=297318 RepID=UPI0035E42E30